MRNEAERVFFFFSNEDDFYVCIHLRWLERASGIHGCYNVVIVVWFCLLFVLLFQHWEVFKVITEVFILVPALVGLKGNLEMTLAARLSTAVYMYFCFFALNNLQLPHNQWVAQLMSNSRSVMNIFGYLMVSMLKISTDYSNMNIWSLLYVQEGLCPCTLKVLLLEINRDEWLENVRVSQRSIKRGANRKSKQSGHVDWIFG